MAAVKKSASKTSSAKRMKCVRCGKSFEERKFYSSRSDKFKANGRIDVCQECLNEIYDNYMYKYEQRGYNNADRKAIDRVCMMFDVYYSDRAYESAKKRWDKDGSTSLMAYYMQITRLASYINKTYDDTIGERFMTQVDDKDIGKNYDDDDVEHDVKVREGKRIFGNRFAREDYPFLYDEYMDWTARHECNTKAQEENFKRICITQLQMLKADVAGNVQDMKQLNEQYLKLTDASKLMPKQNAGDTTAENQTFGTLIEKWERTDPISEPEDELKDVDRIGLYLDVFFRGHLAKMVGIKNAFSNLYDKFMEKYTARKPEYVEDDDDESMFEAVFGKANLDEDIPLYPVDGDEEVV